MQKSLKKTLQNFSIRHTMTLSSNDAGVTTLYTLTTYNTVRLSQLLTRREVGHFKSSQAYRKILSLKPPAIHQNIWERRSSLTAVSSLTGNMDVIYSEASRQEKMA